MSVAGEGCCATRDHSLRFYRRPLAMANLSRFGLWMTRTREAIRRESLAGNHSHCSLNSSAESQPHVPVIHMEGANAPSRAPKTLFTYNTPNNLSELAIGCDSDIGGQSTANLELDQSTVHDSSIGRPTTRFWGNMSLVPKPGMEDKIRSGYASFRNKVRMSTV